VISVIIPVYNAAPFVRKAVLSAISLDEVSEVLLIEDNSPDDSLVICQALSREFEKVKLFRHPDGGNHGAGASRNLGIRNAKCDYIAFLDADDYYLSNRFQISLPILISNPTVDGVFEAGGVEFENDYIRLKWLSTKGLLFNSFILTVADTGLLKSLDDGSGSLQTNAITVRRSVFDLVGMFDEHLLLLQDTALWWKMAMVCSLVPGEIKKPVTIRLVHRGNRSAEHWSAERIKARIEMYRTLWTWCKKKNICFTKRRRVLARLVGIETRESPHYHKLFHPIALPWHRLSVVATNHVEWALTPIELLYAYYYVSGLHGLIQRVGRLMGKGT